MTSYKSAGVSIHNADKFVDTIKTLVKKTFNRSVISGIGNFGAFYQLDFKKYKDPVLVSSTDGVGTKVKIASLAGKFDTVGEDLINHCVNDIAVCGAIPLFFLDYYATGKLKVGNAVDIVKGLVRGCVSNNMSLIGGETAEMPGVYSANDFDLAGTIVGVVDKSKILNSADVRKTDVLIAFKSSGLHTNGYSLVRKIFSVKDYSRKFGGLRNTLGTELLKVHRSYLNIIQTSLKYFDVKSFSHITGGGIIGNTKRVVPKHLSIDVDWNSWKRPEIYGFIKDKGDVPENDMRKTFNLGIGLIAIIGSKDAEKFIGFWKRKNEKCFIIGDIK
ncbi:MAG: phosphoribosylformylglycinamidine cyclo-ligase [Ignavibacteria bacterium]|jgi:phosphoribosylformylglycinamidine cyclo-ligase|nr:phosphoribosylformylglycinamidine cyclo-ligase [Ignavibacteria bacterium]